MKNKLLKFKNTTGGYAILFTVVIISALAALAAGMSNSILKQFILSSTARESQIAFYQADTAAECAIYAVEIEGISNLPTPWQCGVDEGGTNPMDLILSTISTDVYRLGVSLPFTGGACFSINIDQSTSVPAPYTTKILARGYNTCDDDDPKQVERGIEVDY